MLLYIIILICVFLNSLTPSLDFLFEHIFDTLRVPYGYRTFLVAVFVVICLLTVIFRCKKRIVFPLLASYRYWVPWFLLLLVSGLFSEIGVWKFQQYVLRIIITCMAMSVLYMADPKLFEKIFMPLLLSVNIFLVVYLTVTNVSILDGAKGIERNIWLSRSIGMNFLYLAIHFKISKHKIWLLLLGFILLVLMLLIGSRGPIISLITTLFIYVMVKLRWKPHLIIAGTAPCILLYVIFINSPFMIEKYESFMTHGKKMSVEESFEGRTGIYGPSFEIFMDSPLWGVGLGKWWFEYRKNNLHPMSWFATKFKREGRLDYTYPHNIIAEILSELGIIGILFFGITFLPLSRLGLFGEYSAYNYLVILSFMYALSSSDITQNTGIMIFNVLSYLQYQEIRNDDGNNGEL